jgi:DNA-binding NarL/FixJ family response regulator
LRVLIADDDDRFAAALQALLESEGLRVAGRARNGVEAIELAERLRPSVVTMDISMPIMDGVRATQAITALGIPVVLVSGSDAPQQLRDALEAGAVATILKTEAATSLAPLLREVLRER